MYALPSISFIGTILQNISGITKHLYGVLEEKIIFKDVVIGGERKMTEWG
jgi:hypothetical protein